MPWNTLANAISSVPAVGNFKSRLWAVVINCMCVTTAATELCAARVKHAIEGQSCLAPCWWTRSTQTKLFSPGRTRVLLKAQSIWKQQKYEMMHNCDIWWNISAFFPTPANCLKLSWVLYNTIRSYEAEQIFLSTKTTMKTGGFHCIMFFH